MVASGFALDLHRSVTTKQHIQQATDLAALSGAHVLRNVSLADRATFKQTTRKVFDQHKNGIYGDVTCDYDADYNRNTGGADGGWVKIVSNCQVPTIFGRSISGRNKIDVTATSFGRIARTTLDIALVLDVSQSMAGSRMATLKTAAEAMVDDLINPIDQVRFSIIPYQESVNPGVYGYDALGFNSTDSDSVVDPEGDGRDRFCVTERLGEQAYTDAAPSAGQYVGAPNTLVDYCDAAEITPLTDDGDDLKARIGNLVATTAGGTAGHVGIAWGWYTLSPNWAGIWPVDSTPVAYGNPSELKVMVLMTDGAFNMWNYSVTPAVDNATEQSEYLCAAMKAEGIIIFTIAFDAPANVQTLMAGCATSPAHYFNATSEDDLENAFDSISDRFAGTRISPS